MPTDAQRNRSRMQAQAALNRPSLTFKGITVEFPAPPPPVCLVATSVRTSEHPVVGSVHPTWFRTLRVVMEFDGVHVARHELLGEFRTEAEARAFCNSEQWRAIVADGRSNQKVFDNGAPKRQEGIS